MIRKLRRIVILATLVGGVIAFQAKNVFCQDLKMPVNILLVGARPGDEIAYSGTVYKLTHLLHCHADLVLMTNGEGDYKYATLADPIYHRDLTNGTQSKDYLSAIHKKEELEAGSILGIRNYYFLDQPDDHKAASISQLFQTEWDTSLVVKRLRDILNREHYDFIFTLLASSHMTPSQNASTLLTMQALKGSGISRPVVLGTSLEVINSDTIQQNTGLSDYSLIPISTGVPVLTFDRTQKFGYDNKLNYKIICNWVIAAHKTEGALQLLMGKGDTEYFYYYKDNPENGYDLAAKLFDMIRGINYPPAGKVNGDQ